MAKYRVWLDYKSNTEAEDGKEYDTISPDVAAVLFGEERYSVMQHVDPGRVFVRDLETNAVSRWDISARVVVSAQRQGKDDDA